MDDKILGGDQSIRFSKGMVILLYIILLLSLFIPNGVYICIGLFTLLIITRLLWRVYAPGVLIFAYLFQWLQVFTFIFWMFSQGKGMDDIVRTGSYAFILANFGFILMAGVTRLYLSNLPKYNMLDFIKSAGKVDQRRLLVLYILSTLLLSGIGFQFGSMSGVTQILVTLSSVKWIFVLWLGAVIWVRNTHRLWLILIILYEFVYGLYSYFSSFKEVIIFVIILSLTFIVVVYIKWFFRLILTALMLAFFFLTWTAVKKEYRNYLNQSKKLQVISVSRSEAYSTLLGQLQKLKSADYQEALNSATFRIQYLYHFALTLDYVPQKLPYQNGEVWGQTITHIITPRIFNPNKKVYSASVKTSKFTGKRFSGLKEGASFSLGYFADCYVDFGPIGMFFMLSIIALLMAWIFKVFYSMYNLNVLLRFSLINTSLYVFCTFEVDGLYLMGRILTDFVVFYLLAKFVFPAIQKWVCNE